MADFIYSTALTEKGIWLIDSNALDRLDQTVEEEWRRLTEADDRSIAKEFEKEVVDFDVAPDDAERRARITSRLRDAWGHRRTREIILHFTDGARLSVQTFAEAARHAAIEGKKCNGFDLKLEVAQVACNLDGRWDRLELKVSPETDSSAREAFASFRQWVRAHQPPRWTKFWDRFLVWMLFLIPFTIMAPLVADSTKAASAAKMEARKLLDGGLEAHEQLKAIELLLALQSDYAPTGSTTKPATRSQMPLWFRVFLFGGFTAAILLSFRPPFTLGIGRGVNSIRRWRWYMNLIAVAIPAYLFGQFALPWLQGLISSRLLAP